MNSNCPGDYEGSHMSVPALPPPLSHRSNGPECSLCGSWCSCWEYKLKGTTLALKKLLFGGCEQKSQGRNPSRAGSGQSRGERKASGLGVLPMPREWGALRRREGSTVGGRIQASRQWASLERTTLRFWIQYFAFPSKQGLKIRFRSGSWD